MERPIEGSLPGMYPWPSRLGGPSPGRGAQRLLDDHGVRLDRVEMAAGTLALISARNVLVSAWRALRSAGPRGLTPTGSRRGSRRARLLQRECADDPGPGPGSVQDFGPSPTLANRPGTPALRPASDDSCRQRSRKPRRLDRAHLHRLHSFHRQQPPDRGWPKGCDPQNRRTAVNRYHRTWVDRDLNPPPKNPTIRGDGRREPCHATRVRPGARGGTS